MDEIDTTAIRAHGSLRPSEVRALCDALDAARAENRELRAEMIMAEGPDAPAGEPPPAAGAHCACCRAVADYCEQQELRLARTVDLYALKAVYIAARDAAVHQPAQNPVTPMQVGADGLLWKGKYQRLLRAVIELSVDLPALDPKAVRMRLTQILEDRGVDAP